MMAGNRGKRGEQGKVHQISQDNGQKSLEKIQAH